MIDWRRFCSVIGDQKSCGSCTAWATWGVWETLLRMSGEDYDGSEKDLFLRSGGKCATGNQMAPVFNTAKKWIASEEDCPYTPNDKRCQKPSDWMARAKKLKRWKEITKLSEMKEQVLKAPLVGVMTVHQSFLHYRGGVYSPLGVQDPIVGYHAIGIVGYDEKNNAWLIRNSWNSSWGIQGYGWIRCGVSEIDEVMYSLTLSWEEPPDDIEPEEKSWWQKLWDLLMELFGEIF